MKASGVLLDTGPIVALLSKEDANHDRARQLFATCTPPFRCCEAVIAEACFLMRKVDPAGPAEVVALGRRRVYEITFNLGSEWASVEALLRKYADRPISLADACLIRCAEVHEEPRILTFDDDFRVYRWAKAKKFQPLTPEAPASVHERTDADF
ncbi:MAG: PIN domain-containing protein [Vicinamibacterales bacterium]|nr:PIN domain-containing protein [Vicinamibacterales bacterium]